MARARASNDDSLMMIDELHSLVMHLLVECQDPLYSKDEQGRLLNASKEVRHRRMQLRQMRFDANTAGYADATEALEKTNIAIQDAIDRINDLIEFFKNLSVLTSALDRIIRTAVAIA